VKCCGCRISCRACYTWITCRRDNSQHHLLVAPCHPLHLSLLTIAIPLESHSLHFLAEKQAHHHANEQCAVSLAAPLLERPPIASATVHLATCSQSRSTFQEISISFLLAGRSVPGHCKDLDAACSRASDRNLLSNTLRGDCIQRWHSLPRQCNSHADAKQESKHIDE
jgi:hypothetical protein